MQKFKQIRNDFVLFTTILLFGLSLSLIVSPVSSRAVNISNTWILPEEGFPVFYRYFRDRISWYEADAVCQFHHANLVTVDTTAQYDATRAYLKELDIVNNVWIGLIKSKPDGEFTWTERREYRPLSHEGYWDEQVAQSSTPVCVSTDPAADFRWHAHHCGGPEVASFICELPVPSWASQPNGCMLTSLPSLTVLYLPEQAAVELTSDCGLGGTKSIVCKGQANREEMIRQLSCGISPEDFDDKNVSKSSSTMNLSSIDSESVPTTIVNSDVTTAHNKDVDPTKNWFWSANTIDIEGYDSPTRHRRETDHTDLPATLSTLHASTMVIPSSTMIQLEQISANEKVKNFQSKSNIEVHEDVDFRRIETSKTENPASAQKILMRNENIDDVEVFNPLTGPNLESKHFEELVDDTLDIDDKSSNTLEDNNGQKHVNNERDNFFAPVEKIEPKTNSNQLPIPATQNNIQSTVTITPTTAVREKITQNITIPPSLAPLLQQTTSNINKQTHLTISDETLPSTQHVVVTSIDEIVSTSNDPIIQRFENSEPDFPSAINQGQLFGGENGTHFDIDADNDTTEITITLTTPSENHSKHPALEHKTANIVEPTDKSERFTKVMPSTVINTLQESSTNDPNNMSENIKLLELDTDFVATRKDNNSKFIEIDDSYTIGGGDPHEHKIIEINIIDRKSKNSIPSKLIITTKVNNKAKKSIASPLFTSSVKKDGKNIKPVSNSSSVKPSKIIAFNETFTEISNETTIQDFIVIDPKLNKLNHNKITKTNNNSETISTAQRIPPKDVIVPERIKEQEIQTRKQQEENFRREFQSIPPKKILIDDNNPENNQFPDENENGATIVNNDELNSEVPPSHKHRGRLLTRSPHHNYYPYFFSRVLG